MMWVKLLLREPQCEMFAKNTRVYGGEFNRRCVDTDLRICFVSKV